MQWGSLKLNHKIQNLHFSKNKIIKLGVRIINYPNIIIIIIIIIINSSYILKIKGASIKEETYWVYFGWMSYA